MNKFFLILLLTIFAVTAPAGIITTKTVLNVTSRVSSAECLEFKSGSGDVKIYPSTGKVVLTNTTVEEAAEAFWVQVTKKCPELLDVTGKLKEAGAKPTHVAINASAGIVILNLGTGKVNWSKGVSPDANSRLFYDALVLHVQKINGK